eukprot:431215-Prorocentrum_lima.AAC.1
MLLATPQPTSARVSPSAFSVRVKADQVDTLDAWAFTFLLLGWMALCAFAAWTVDLQGMLVAVPENDQ